MHNKRPLLNFIQKDICPLMKQDKYLEIVNLINTRISRPQYSKLVEDPLYKEYIDKIFWYQIYAYNALGGYETATQIYKENEESFNKAIDNDLFYKIQFEFIFSLTESQKTQEAYDAFFNIDIKNIPGINLTISFLTELLAINNQNNCYIENFNLFVKHLELLNKKNADPNKVSDFYIEIANSFINYEDINQYQVDLKKEFCTLSINLIENHNEYIEQRNKEILLQKVELIQLQLINQEQNINQLQLINQKQNMNQLQLINQEQNMDQLQLINQEQNMDQLQLINQEQNMNQLQ